MSLHAYEQASPESDDPSWRLGAVGALLQSFADEWAVTCLLEDPSGAVVTHAFAARRPDLFVQAVLDRSARALHSAARERRARLVTTAGATQSLMVGDDLACLLPVSASGRCVGQLWVVPHEEQPSWERMLEHAAAVAQLLTDPPKQPTHWMDKALAGVGPLPRPFANRPLHVVAVRRSGRGTGSAGDALRAAARRRPAACAHVAFLDTDQGAIGLVAGGGSPPTQMLTQWCQDAADIDGSRIAAVVAGPAHDVTCLPVLRSQVEQALRAAPRDGVCVSLAAVRSSVVLDRLTSVLDDLPDLGRDPLQDLLDHDQARGTSLASTLLAWLDAHGDVALAAAAMQVHTNTLRYRIRRAHEVLAVDRHDPATRLELHLRLRRAARAS